MELIHKHFKLNQTQAKQFEALPALYREWNNKVNVVSRKDIENLEIHHLLHSVTIAKYISFKAGANVLDLGTGGGLPGIPLAILFPDTAFHLIDRTLKKIKVVQAISETLGLENVVAKQKTAEEHKIKYDFVVSRAVTQMNKLLPLAKPLIKKEMVHGTPNGLITLKGGNIKEELKGLQQYHEVVPLTKYFKVDYFKEKYLIYVQT